MSNVLQFPQRQRSDVRPMQPSEREPKALSLVRTGDDRPMPAPQPVEAEAIDPVAGMLASSAAMTVVATLAFYAKQGWDGGKMARNALNAMTNVMGQGAEVEPAVQ